MDFKSAIEGDLKNSLKQKDTLRVSILRMLLASIKNKEVEKRNSLSEEEFYAVVKTSIKQHVESVESFKKGQRLDLAQKEEKELEILKTFLPSQLSEGELSVVIDNAIRELAATGKKDMGKVMKFILDKYPGQVDGKVVSNMVLKRLSPE